MEPKENHEAAERAYELVSELHEIFSANGWPIACIGITDHGKGRLQVIGTNQINMKAQFPILMSTGKRGSNLIKAAKAIDSDEDEVLHETLKDLLGKMARTLASNDAQEASGSKQTEVSA